MKKLNELGVKCKLCKMLMYMLPPIGTDDNGGVIHGEELLFHYHALLKAQSKHINNKVNVLCQAFLTNVRICEMLLKDNSFVKDLSGRRFFRGRHDRRKTFFTFSNFQQAGKHINSSFSLGRLIFGRWTFLFFLPKKDIFNLLNELNM